MDGVSREIGEDPWDLRVTSEARIIRPRLVTKDGRKTLGRGGIVSKKECLTTKGSIDSGLELVDGPGVVETVTQEGT